jgi:hypothetical protein
MRACITKPFQSAVRSSKLRQSARRRQRKPALPGATIDTVICCGAMYFLSRFLAGGRLIRLGNDAWLVLLGTGVILLLIALV